MPNIVPSKPISIETELGNLSQYKYFPNKIISATLNRLTDMLDGRIDIVNPSNPFTYLIETSCLNTAFAIQEYTLLTRKLYPRLANSEKDLYIHMSDFDYLGIFAEPAYGTLTFNILLNDFLSKAYYDYDQKRHILKIPRQSAVEVGGYSFYLPAAIIVSVADNGVIDVYYENQDYKTLFNINTTHITFSVIKINQTETYIQFSLNLPEISIETTEIPIERSKLFKGDLPFNSARQFYFLRAFYHKNNTWNEMLVTHTNEVYDINTPTCIINVLQKENKIEYLVPSVYINTGMISGKIKFLIHTTQGAIDVDFANYNVDEFKLIYLNTFPDIELDQTTTALPLITKTIYTTDKVIGGKNGIDFPTLKQSVINNSIGDRQLPITRKQLGFLSSQTNYTLINDVDNVTNRIFLLSLNLPQAQTRYPIAKLNLDILEYKTTLTDIVNKNGTLKYSPTLYTLKKGTLFTVKNSSLYQLTAEEVTAIESLSNQALVESVNSNKYFYLFYHYVIELVNDILYLRAYQLDTPYVSNINFRLFNDTAKIAINTIGQSVRKSDSGYTITVTCNLKQYDPKITVDNVKPYLVYTAEEGSYYFLPGTLYTTDNNNPIYTFTIQTEYILNSSNAILVNNFVDRNNSLTPIWIPINSDFKFLYLSDTMPDNYRRSNIDPYIDNSFLNVNTATITLEDISLTFGYHLENLYTRSHSALTVDRYQTYTNDVVLRYTTNVYDTDNTIIHHKGDIVEDSLGSPIYVHRKGDVVLDSSGNPIPLGIEDIDRFLSLMFIDYKSMLTTNTNIKNYISYLQEYLLTNIVINSSQIEDVLLENTQAFVTIPKNLDYVQVTANGIVYHIPSMQVFTFNVYVTESVYQVSETLNSISYSIIKQLDDYLYTNTVLIKTELLDIIYSSLKESVKSISISQFTELNEEYIVINDPTARISLDKILVNDATGYDLKENVTINFIAV